MILQSFADAIVFLVMTTLATTKQMTINKVFFIDIAIILSDIMAIFNIWRK